jgi:hypothetical protein
MESIQGSELYSQAVEAVVDADTAFSRAPEEDGPERSALQSSMYAQRNALAAIIDAHTAQQVAAAVVAGPQEPDKADKADQSA